jgi:hypothetical protein
MIHAVSQQNHCSVRPLKGTVSRNFRLLVFLMNQISFPQAPEYIIRTTGLPPISTTLTKLVAKFATGGAPWLANISVNFRKNFETVLMGFSGAGGKETDSWQNQRQKILYQIRRPLGLAFVIYFGGWENCCRSIFSWTLICSSLPQSPDLLVFPATYPPPPHTLIVGPHLNRNHGGVSLTKLTCS